MAKLKVLDLFAGTRSIARAFERRCHETYSYEIMSEIKPTLVTSNLEEYKMEEIV